MVPEKIKPGILVLAVLLLAGLFFYFFLAGGASDGTGDNSADCAKCSRKRSGLYPGDSGGGGVNETSTGEANYFLRIFTMLGSGTEQAQGTVIEREPEKDKAINEINSLSRAVCNDENLPEDVWISPKLIEKNPEEHKAELQKLVSYCSGIKNGRSSSNERKEYYRIKIRLLEERKELIKYYIDTLDGQIEEMNEKRISEMEDRSGPDAITPEEENINDRVQAETNRFFEESVVITNKLMEQIDSAIKMYKTELERL